MKSIIVNKPWGYEYECYKNSKVSIWFLCLKSGASTSLHCHPNKETGYLVLKGNVKLKFLRGFIMLKNLSKISIFKKSFHQSQNIGLKDAFILEAETPDDKFDLVRLEDNYGREFKKYENKKSYIPKTGDELKILEPTKGKPFKIKKFDLTFQHIFLEDLLKEKHKFKRNDVFVFTKGGFKNGKKTIIEQAGVLDGKTLILFNEKFDYFKNSKLLHVSK